MHNHSYGKLITLSCKHKVHLLCLMKKAKGFSNGGIQYECDCGGTKDILTVKREEI